MRVSQSSKKHYLKGCRFNSVKFILFLIVLNTNGNRLRLKLKRILRIKTGCFVDQRLDGTKVCGRIRAAQLIFQKVPAVSVTLVTRQSRLRYVRIVLLMGHLFRPRMIVGPDISAKRKKSINRFCLHKRETRSVFVSLSFSLNMIVLIFKSFKCVFDKINQ